MNPPPVGGFCAGLECLVRESLPCSAKEMGLEGCNMDLRTLLARAVADSGRDRRSLYEALLASTLWARGPEIGRWLVSNPENGQRALPLFLTEADADGFWAQAAPGSDGHAESTTLKEAAAAARRAGALVIDPMDAGFMIERVDLVPLAAGEVPGAFAAWLQEPDRLQRQPEDVSAGLGQAHLFVLAGRSEGEGEAPRLYLLTKSEDGTVAVPCFSSPATLSQFADVRRLDPLGEGYAVALYPGAECLRIAAGLGAYLIVDPESPWETQIEPLRKFLGLS